MANVKRVYAEKKPAYAVRAEELMSEIKEYLNIQSVTGRPVLIYRLHHVSEVCIVAVTNDVAYLILCR